MKKTISVDLGKEDYIIALMKDINFVEIDRSICGGTMSSEKIQLTFEGDESDYNENGYVQIINNTPYVGYSYYYSLGFPEGYYTNDIERFKSVHLSKQEITVSHF